MRFYVCARQGKKKGRGVLSFEVSREHYIEVTGFKDSGKYGEYLKSANCFTYYCTN